MKKLLLLTLLLIPALASAQLRVSGIGGDNGYTAAKASYYFRPSGENYAIIPMYSYYKDTDTEGAKSVSRFGLRGEYYTNSFDFGVEGGYSPESNGYQNYSAAGDVRYYFLRNVRNQFLSTLYIGAGVSYTKHEQDEGYTNPYSLTRSLIPQYELEETRVQAMAGAKISIISLNTVYSKGFYSETPLNVQNAWTDIPFFMTVNRAYLDYYWTSTASIPWEMFRLHGGYSLARDKGAKEDFQSVNAGLTVTISNISVTGNVEVVDFDSSDNKVYYSLSGGLAF
ncbi:hypothetical protein Dip510_000344 [Elusimicrobium posterum]|uniref:hypothetical protein n=1 Tax=Elusimicrobium posterum TaxID=3116653 RepID=UPI003C7098C8